MKIGIDITSGYAADSLYAESGPKDPWRRGCMAGILHDFMLYDDVVYPLPSQIAINNIDDSDLPSIFIQAARERYDFIKPYTAKPADEISLDSDKYRKLFKAFVDWVDPLKTPLEDLHSLSDLHRFNPKIIRLNDKTVPIKLFDGDYSVIDIAPLTSSLNLPSNRIEYLFDIYVRTIRYDDILVDRQTHFHPFRSSAYLDDTKKQSENDVWSLACYFTHLVEDDPEYYEIERILGYVSEIKEAARSMQVDLSTLRGMEQAEVFQNLVCSTHIDVPLKGEVKKHVEFALSLAGMMMCPVDMFLSRALFVGTSLVHYSSDTVPAYYGTRKIKIMREVMDFKRMMSKQIKM